MSLACVVIVALHGLILDSTASSLLLPLAAGYALVPLLNHLGQLLAAGVFHIVLANCYVLAASVALGPAANVEAHFLAVTATTFLVFEQRTQRRCLAFGVGLSVACELLLGVIRQYSLVLPIADYLGLDAVGLRWLGVSNVLLGHAVVVFCFLLHNSDAHNTELRLRSEIAHRSETEAKLKESESRAVAADQAKGHFLAVMSHEIRTPLNGIIGMTQLLNRDDSQRDMARNIRHCGDSLLAIINDILDYSKIENGKMTIEEAQFSLEDVLEDTVGAVSSAISDKDVELICDIAPSLPDTVIADALRLRQCVTNLLSNALKFTSDGHVLLRVSREPDPLTTSAISLAAKTQLASSIGTPAKAETVEQLATSATAATLDTASTAVAAAANPPIPEVSDTVTLRIEVEDTGIGIPPGLVCKLFKPYSQAHISSRTPGTGLGLAITKQLATLMGGQVGVFSKEGSGSTFWMTFKCRLPTTHAKTKLPPKLSEQRSVVSHQSASDLHKLLLCHVVAQAALPGRRLLLLDRSLPSRSALARVMSGWKCQVDAFEAEADARRALQQQPPGHYSALIIDWKTSAAASLENRPMRAASAPEDDDIVRGWQRHGVPVVFLRRSAEGRMVLTPSTGMESSDLECKASSPVVVPVVVAKPVRRLSLRSALLRVLQVPTGPAGTPTVVASAAAEELRSQQQSDARILVAEDNQVNQIVVTKLLRNLGYRNIKVVQNGQEALDAFKAGAYDVILMDCNMPVMDGFQATRAVRMFEDARMAAEGRRSVRRIPVIALTASAMESDREACLRAGMSEFISKPILKHVLQKALEVWLSKDQLHLSDPAERRTASPPVTPSTAAPSSPAWHR